MQMEKFKFWFLKKEFVNKCILWIKGIHLPGVSEVSAWETGVFLFRELGNSSFNVRAAAMAFNFFFALFPALIFSIALLPLIPGMDLESTMESYLQHYLPRETYDLVIQTVNDSLASNVNSVLSISVFLVLFSSSRGILVMMYAFHRDLPGFKERSFIDTQLSSIGMVILLSLFFLSALAVTIFAEVWLSFLPLDELPFPKLSVWAIRLLDIVLTLLILLVGFGILYKWVPSREIRWKLFSPGALVGSLFAVIATFAFAVFIANFSNYNKIYGGISAIMILMVWMYWISMVILLGFELNLAIEKAKDQGIKVLDV